MFIAIRHAVNYFALRLQSDDLQMLSRYQMVGRASVD